MSEAVLFSGGLDSVVLLADRAAAAGDPGRIHPIYVSAGLAWEEAERRAAAACLAAVAAPVAPLVTLSVDMSDVYSAAHWAVRGQPPGYHTADEEVYLPGRNVILLSKAAIYCAIAGIDRLLLGTLAGNPFPDATPRFRHSMAETLSLGLRHQLNIDAPYASLRKADIIRRGAALGLRLEQTLSCMQPDLASDPVHAPRHCGRCSKCRERHDAFVEAGVADATRYVSRDYVAAASAAPPP
jgi:7-cyano-7-deazaguanine synthase